MPDVFISYARATAPQARQVEQALESEGYEVWRDDELPVHRAFADVIAERLRDAKAVVVLWSADAVSSQWVRSEADRARAGRKLVQASLDDAVMPMPFDQVRCADLSAWSGDPSDPEWRTLLDSVGALVRGAAAPEREAGPSAPGERPSLPLPSKPSIAVLPFKNISGDPEKEYFADAVTEDIVTALSRWRWFFVVARHSSFTYKDREIHRGRIGHELGVRYLLEGSVRAAGRQVRINAQLIDATTGEALWADKLDRELVNVLALQDEITEQVVAAIEPAILQGESVRAARKSLKDFSALDCCYRAMWRLNSLSVEADEEAFALFEEAVRRDPGLALAHVGLARIQYGRAIYGFSPEPVPSLRASHESAQRAIGLDPRDAYGYFASAGASLYLGDHASAAADARRAIALNPNFAYGHYRLGQVLIFSGSPAEAVAPIEHSLRLSPYDPQLGPMLETLALAHYQAGDYARAAEHARTAGRMTGGASSVLAASLARLGDAEGAARAYARARSAPRSPQRPMAAPYADPVHLDHLREGFRLAGAGAPQR